MFQLMHGLIFAEFAQFVRTRVPNFSWENLLGQSGLQPIVYMYIRSYPDHDLMALVTTLSRATQKPVPAILEEFGEFIVPHLLETYGYLLDPSWKTLDVLERTEDRIHMLIHARDPNATPPCIRCIRSAPNEVTIHYGSHRKMCGFAKGIVKGLARHYNDQISMTETSCMLENGSECILIVKCGFEPRYAPPDCAKPSP